MGSHDTSEDSAQAGPTPLEVRMLGPFRLARGGRTLRLPTHRAECLLAYLVLHPEAHLHERLAGRFWADVSDAQARHSLRTALAVIRQVLGTDAILTDREAVRLNPDYPLWVDVRAFEALAGMGHELVGVDPLQGLAELYRGDLLAEFDDEWIGPERERLRAQYLAALLRGVQQLRSAAQYAQAIQWAQQVLAIEPTSEGAHQYLIFCYAAQGERTTALKQYEECRRVLREELNAEPSAETTALYERVKQELSGGQPFAVVRTNLPAPLTSFIGRQQELADLKQLLSTTRLLTLTGAGGCGKTRLALQVASQVLDQYPHGAWFIELAPLSDPSLVPHAVASAMGVLAEERRPVMETLLHYLSEKDLLLTLDNCEHLIEGCAQFASTVLRQCAHVTVLATSREPLGSPGETSYRVPSLGTPDPSRLPSTEALNQYDAVTLLVERARAALPAFRLSEANAPAVAQICHRLDGIPLALELAAARVRGLSVEQIAAHLDDRFRLLIGGSRTALPRHQTLRALIDWSYGLLSESERVLLNRLSVFAGGWTLEAAETVCSDDNGAGQRIPLADVLDLLLRLVDKSLVVHDEQNPSAGSGQAGESRYRLLETIRQYARDRLLDSGESDGVRNRHLDYFLQFAESAAPKLHGPEQLEWADRLDADHDNVRAAFEWSRGAGRVEKGMHLAAALTWYWDMRGNLTEARDQVVALLAQPEAAPRTLLRARALFAAVGPTQRFGDSIRFLSELEEMIAIARAHLPAAKSMLAIGLLQLANQLDVNEPDRARALREEGWALAQDLDEPWEKAWVLSDRAWRLNAERDYPRAYQAAEESLRLFRMVGDGRLAACQSAQIGSFLITEGHFATARAPLEQSLAYARQAKDGIRVIIWLNILGELARGEGNDSEAKRCYLECIRLRQEMGVDSIVPMCNLVWVHVHLGEYEQAKELLRQTLAIAQAARNTDALCYLLEGFAALAAARGQPERAARLFGAAERLADSLGIAHNKNLDAVDVAEHERNVAMARAQLDEATFNAVWAEGRALTLEQAIAEARLVTAAKPTTRSEPAPPPAYPAGLTEREVEVLGLLARGLSNAEIGEQLVVSPRTVGAHLRSIFGKLDVTTRTAAARVAAELKLV